MACTDSINIKPALLERMLNSPFSETVKKLFNSPDFFDTWRALSSQDALREDQCAHDANEIAYTIIHVACTPPDWFFQDIDWVKENHKHDALNKKIRNLLDVLSGVSVDGLQTKNDINTKFSNTGHTVHIDRFLNDLQSRLNFLGEICEAPPPPKSKHQPTKLLAKRAISTARASIIKAEILKWYKRPHYKEIANLINAIDYLDEPFTEDDVAKSRN